MKKISMGLSVLVLLFGIAHNAAADLIPINNQGFEDLLLSPGQFVYSVPGWETTGFVSTFYPTDVYFIGGAPEGHNTVALGAGATGPASVSQVLSDVLTADTSYTLAVDVGRRL